MDKRIDLRLRKPRQAKGTPFYTQRNYWAGGVLLFGAASWILIEISPGGKKLKTFMHKILQDSEVVKQKASHVKIAWTDPAVSNLLTRAREKEAYKDEPEPESRFFKVLKELREIPVGVDPSKNE